MAKTTKNLNLAENDFSKLDLKFLGIDYQQELVKCFIEDQQFFMSNKVFFRGKCHFFV